MTMHLAKGLEFRAVAVMACDDEVIPSQERIAAVSDESDLDDVYQTEPGFYLGGEPIYVDGCAIVQRLNTRDCKAEILIFDAAHVARGPIAALPLRHMIHPGFHASWAPE